MRNSAQTSDLLLPLVEQLLDAHRDSVELALELPATEELLNQIECLSALQREGKSILAHLPTAPPHRRTA